MSSYQTSRNPHRLYRDPENGKIAGVCAGVAEYFGFNRTAVRIITFIAMLFVWPIAIYLLLAIVLKRKPDAQYASPEQEQFWRGVHTAPRDVFGDVRLAFRDLEMRLQRMEAYVTSKEFEFDRQLPRG